MPDYRDDRSALRSRNAELEEKLEAATTSLAERERELAELRDRVPPEPVLPPPRAEVPLPTPPPDAEQTLDWKRVASIWFSALLLVMVVSSLASKQRVFGVRPSAVLSAGLLVSLIALVVVHWPRKR